MGQPWFRFAAACRRRLGAWALEQATTTSLPTYAWILHIWKGIRVVPNSLIVKQCRLVGTRCPGDVDWQARASYGHEVFSR